MTWLILTMATAIVGFYLRFLWEMSKELLHFRRERPSYRKLQPSVRRNLFRMDPAYLWAEKSGRDSSRINDNF